MVLQKEKGFIEIERLKQQHYIIPKTRLKESISPRETIQEWRHKEKFGLGNYINRTLFKIENQDLNK